MDGQEYLNQISAGSSSSRRASGSLPSWMSSIYFKVIAGGVLLLIIIMIIGAALGSGRTSTEDKCYSLLLRVNGTVEMIEEYQSSVKSSDLRSSSASLSGILSNTSRDLESYVVDKYNYKEKNVSTKISTAAEEEETELNNDLFEAKINGILDRIYAHKMAYMISLIMSDEASINKATNDSDLSSIITTSYTSLENLYDKFDSFSETK